MPGDNRNPYGTLGLVTGIGFNWAASILVGVYGGRWLDGRLHTRPAFTIAGILLGTAAGAMGTYQMVSRYFK